MSELYRLIHAEKATYPIVLLCRVLKVARSSYYAWREGEAARRARQAADNALAHEITVLHISSRHTYGVPRIHAELRRPGRRVNRKRVARVMRERVSTVTHFPTIYMISVTHFPTRTVTCPMETWDASGCPTAGRGPRPPLPAVHMSSGSTGGHG
ncbi:IS3 family transposase [Streptomyces sp. NPDC056831]|uniref:IS3 family transposase n=1 Tax=Streptomyces sp. NPDC056831 TaxID=3345954 RepID=UPI0036A20BC9